MHAPPSATVETRAVIDTTELRWFGDGELPGDITTWFTQDGSVGVVERRCDTYRLIGREDVGFKIRSRETPELKIRQSCEGVLDLGEGCEGHVEVWRKWSPADTRVDGVSGTPWIEVGKTITKRRLSESGVEITPGPVPADPSWVGVDVETVELIVGQMIAWSFAFAAFGPGERRLPAIATCWEHLRRTPSPLSLDVTGLRSCGYPEFLTRRRVLDARSA